MKSNFGKIMLATNQLHLTKGHETQVRQLKILSFEALEQPFDPLSVDNNSKTRMYSPYVRTVYSPYVRVPTKSYPNHRSFLIHVYHIFNMCVMNHFHELLSAIMFHCVKLIGVVFHMYLFSPHGFSFAQKPPLNDSFPQQVLRYVYQCAQTGPGAPGLTLWTVR